jgi:glycine betaine/proline transport system ATP-binding protein
LSFVEGHDRTEMLTARDVMIRPTDVVRGGHSPAVALREMERSGRSWTLVVGPEGRLLGAVSADAAADAARTGVALVREMELDEVPSAAPDESVKALIPVAATTEMPIAVIEDDQLRGIVGRASLLRGLCEALEDAPLEEELAPDGTLTPEGMA